MISQVTKRKTLTFDAPPAKSLSFLYKTKLGRIFLKILINPFVSKLAGLYMNSKLSKRRIPKFIKSAHIDMSEYEKAEFNSFNEFFTRKIIPERRPFDEDKNSFISPCDAKLSAYRINEKSIFKIKGSEYSIYDLIQNRPLSYEYENGYCLIFRLAVDDYHRYRYIDNGKKEKNIYIKGKFHTVQPIALSACNVYKQNAREYSVLHTENFGKVIQIEVGALLVGRIKNLHEEYSFTKGEEKGMFEFGGSTIVLLVKENEVNFDNELFENTENGLETIVKSGETIGRKANI